MYFVPVKSSAWPVTMYPVYGAVSGGTVVTVSGQTLPWSRTSDVSVTISGVECQVLER